MAARTKISHLTLDVVNRRITQLERQQNGGYSAEVAKAFPLGRVGGSGRNTAGKNRRLDREIEGTIKRAGQLAALRARRNVLTNPNPPPPFKKRPKVKVSKGFLDEDRLFIGHYPTGIVYADCHRERDGDFVKLGYLNYRTLELELERKLPTELESRIRAHATKLQKMRGQEYSIAGNATVTLGGE